MIVETRDNTVVRLRPRPNEEVNAFFMCDYGRANYRWMNRRDRLESPAIRGAHGLQDVDWDPALDGAARVLRGKRIFVLASPNLSNEALWLLGRLAARSHGGGAFRIPVESEAPLAGVEDLALRPDRAGNGRGAELMGFVRSDDPLAELKQGDALIIADHDIAEADLAHVARASAVVVLGTALPHRLERGDVVLPICNYVEEEGTVTNLRGRVQRFLQAKAATGLARPSWLVLSDLCTALGDPAPYYIASEVFDALAKSHPEFAGMSYPSLGLKGRTVASAQRAEVGA
jgi:NADH-quinone oxidoreductase subunit G